jgi:hypothetical protein
MTFQQSRERTSSTSAPTGTISWFRRLFHGSSEGDRRFLPCQVQDRSTTAGRCRVADLAGARGSEAGARGSGLAAERHSVLAAAENHDRGAADGSGLRHRRDVPSLGGTYRHGDAVGRTMGLVAVTVGLFTLGAYLARNRRCCIWTIRGRVKLGPLSLDQIAKARSSNATVSRWPAGTSTANS